MTAADREAAARRQRAQTIALWRWSLIEPAMDPALTSRPRGQIGRGLARPGHARPWGRPGGVSRKTIARGSTARAGGGVDPPGPPPPAGPPRPHPPLAAP